MSRAVVWSPAAENDFEDILDYLQNNWSDKAINKFIDKVDDYIQLIRKDAKLFPIIHTELQIRKCVVTKQNTLYYRETHSTIEIVRLFDTRQDPKKLKFE